MDNEKKVGLLWYHKLNPWVQAEIKNEFNIIHEGPWDRTAWQNFLQDKKSQVEAMEL